MKLKKLTLTQSYQSPFNKNSWMLNDIELRDINLFVGKNATGKTRLINVVSFLSKLLSGKNKNLPKDHIVYDVEFEDKKEKLQYLLEYEGQRIIYELFSKGNKQLLERGKDGSGVLFAEEIKKEIKFKVSRSQLAVVAKRDEIQHPYLERFYQWGVLSRVFRFAGDMGRSQLPFLAVLEKSHQDLSDNSDEIMANGQENNNVVAILHNCIEHYGDSFKDLIIEGMNKLDYSITDIGVEFAKELEFSQPLEKPPLMIFLKEESLVDKTTQTIMSQGMFRALALIIQLNYLIFRYDKGLILIDDIGEGLDYERSVALINYVIEKVKNTNIQVVMSTNDRHVMNTVPLEYWTVLIRDGMNCKAYNANNSKKIFDDFEYTGLSNFDFLSTEFFKTGLDSK